MPINVKSHTNKVFKCLLSVSINIYECNLPYILVVHSGVVYTSDQGRIQEFKIKEGDVILQNAATQDRVLHLKKTRNLVQKKRGRTPPSHAP